MARWRTDGDGVRWLEGWADQNAVRGYAARLGHNLDSWYATVDAGPYKGEIGRCKRCDATAGWQLLYRGKIAESIAGEPGDVDAWRKLYRGKHRKGIGIMYGPALSMPCRPSRERD